eukprot:370556-Amphidinium_carterae.1
MKCSYKNFRRNCRRKALRLLRVQVPFGLPVEPPHEKRKDRRSPQTGLDQWSSYLLKAASCSLIFAGLCRKRVSEKEPPCFTGAL